MTDFRTVRANLERARDLLDTNDQAEQHVQSMLDAAIETVLTLECAKRPCEIIPFPRAHQTSVLKR